MAEVSIKPTIYKTRRNADGSYAIKLRVTYQRKSRYLSTTEVAYPADLSKKDMEIKSPALLSRLYDLVRQVNECVAKIDPFSLQVMDVDGVVKEISRGMMKMTPETFRLDFFEFGESFAAGKPKSTASNYRVALSALAAFKGERKCDISEITSTFMRKFEAYLVEKHGPTARAVSLYTSAIATIHSQARKTYNDNELGELLIKNPFEFYTPAKQIPAPRRVTSRRAIQKLIDIRHCLSRYHKVAVDTYLLSFCLMGTNVPDLYDARREGDIIIYNRQKTRDRRYDKAEMQIRMEPVAKKLFDDVLDPDGKRAFSFYKTYTAYTAISQLVNDKLKEVFEIIGEKPLTMYSARHTFASVAYSLGIHKSLINDMLCHVDPDMAVTDIYIEKDWNILWEANRKVLESFDWK